jgi:hypothetical protein
MFGFEPRRPRHSFQSLTSLINKRFLLCLRRCSSRIAWNADREVIAETIANIVQLQHSLIHEPDGKPLVLQTGITAREEVLGHASANRLTRAQLRDAARQKPATLNAAITKMLAAKELRTADDGALALTRMGSVR